MAGRDRKDPNAGAPLKSQYISVSRFRDKGNRFRVCSYQIQVFHIPDPQFITVIAVVPGIGVAAGAGLAVVCSFCQIINTVGQLNDAITAESIQKLINSLNVVPVLRDVFSVKLSYSFRQRGNGFLFCGSFLRGCRCRLRRYCRFGGRLSRYAARTGCGAAACQQKDRGKRKRQRSPGNKFSFHEIRVPFFSSCFLFRTIGKRCPGKQGFPVLPL